MFNIGGQEFALIIVLALVVVGPDQLPGLIRKMGKYAAQARQMSNSLRAEFMAATEPMQDTFKEFQEGMNEFQTGMADLSNTVTEAADVKQWGSGTADDPIVPRGFADGPDGTNGADGTNSSNEAGTSDQNAAGKSGAAADPTEGGTLIHEQGAPAKNSDPWAADRPASGRPDPWAADRVSPTPEPTIQPITQPERAKKKLEVPPPVNPWADVRDHVDVGQNEPAVAASVAEQSELAAQHLDDAVGDASPGDRPDSGAA